MKKTLIFLTLILALASCNKATNLETNIDWNTKKIITSSIVPISSIVWYIGGDNFEINTVVPAWASPHTFELKPEQMIKLEKSDLIFTIWIWLDSFLDKSIENKNTVVLSNFVQLQKWWEHTDEHENENDTKNIETPLEFDPHIWLSSTNASLIAEKIFEELTKLDFDNKEIYKANLANFNNELDNFTWEFSDFKKDKKMKSFIVFHDAYNYLFDDLKIDQSKKIVFEKTPGKEPSSKEFKELIDTIKKNNIKIIFKEPQLSSKIVDVLKSDYGLQVLQLNPLWDDDTKDAYMQNYKNNLETLKNIYE